MWLPCFTVAFLLLKLLFWKWVHLLVWAMLELYWDSSSLSKWDWGETETCGIWRSPQPRGGQFPWISISPSHALHGLQLTIPVIQGLYSIPNTNLLHFFDAQASLALTPVNPSSVNPSVILSDFHSNSLSEPTESIEITLWWLTWSWTWWPTWR